MVAVMSQQLVYDLNSFIGEVGGSLGLFLGASFLSMLDGEQKVVKKIFRCGK